MFAPLSSLRAQLNSVIENKEEQGYETTGLRHRLNTLPDGYDEFFQFANLLSALPLREDWQYVEPNELEDIWGECDPNRHTTAFAVVDLEEAAERIEAGFIASVVGCNLGKPLEVRPTLAELRSALESAGEWPLNDYVSEVVLKKLGRRHRSWDETEKSLMRYVAPDDDINYTILGMLILEKYGPQFSKRDVIDTWIEHLPMGTTFGPERAMLVRAGLSFVSNGSFDGYESWAGWLNPGDELCGALIRADAYGYACPGNPALAAALAWRDASWTHRGTGIYGAMFIAAAIAAAFVAQDPLEIFDIAKSYVPRRSRFYEIVSDSLSKVRSASDWEDGYNKIHNKYKEYGHCRVVQEIGTVFNTVRFSKNVDEAICLQVMQGNDTDSFGATVGSIMGIYFGPGHLEERWIEPFHDDIHTALAWFYERSLSRLAKRMGKLPLLISR